jgi:hypothetical protein
MTRYLKVAYCTELETFNKYYTKPRECDTEFIIVMSTFFPY